MIKQMGKVNQFMLTAMFMRANGSMTKLKVEELILMRMEHIMKGNGQMTNSTEMELKVGQTELNMKDNTQKGKKREMAD